MTAEDLVKLLKKARIPHSTEAEMQVGLEAFFNNRDVRYIREHRFNKKDVVDFMVQGGIALECKIKGQPLAIHRQLERYAAHEEVKGIILFTSKYMGVKETINGKPAFIVRCGEAWL